MANLNTSQSRDAILNPGSTEFLEKRHKKCLEAVPSRYLLTLCIFLGSVVLYITRVNLNMAIVFMVDNYNLNLENSEGTNFSKETSDRCPLDLNSQNQTLVNNRGGFNWTLPEQGVILGGFYYGYLVTQIPGGRLADAIGAKRVYIGGLMAASILTLFTPICAQLNQGALIAVRALIGAAQGAVFPAMYAFFPLWYDSKELTTHLAIGFAGNHIGTIFCMPLTSYLCQYGFAGGWPSVFYTFGTAGCIISTCLIFLIYSRPEEHPRIFVEELHFILENRKGTKKVNAEKASTYKLLTI